MKLTIRELKHLIREFGLDADMRNMAGSVMDIGAHGSSRDKETSIMNPLPGLGGNEEEEDEETDEWQEKSQPGARFADRHPR